MILRFCYGYILDISSYLWDNKSLKKKKKYYNIIKVILKEN